MNAKLYTVQTWDSKGVRTNHYEAWIGSAAELRQLTKFLKEKWSHVTIALMPAKRGR